MQTISQHASSKQANTSGQTNKLSQNNANVVDKKPATFTKTTSLNTEAMLSKAQMAYLKQISRLENKATLEPIQQDMKPVLRGLIKQLRGLDINTQKKLFDSPSLKEKKITSLADLEKTLQKDFLSKPGNIKEGFAILKSEALLTQLFPHLKAQQTYTPYINAQKSSLRS